MGVKVLINNAQKAAVVRARQLVIPPLENGDHLTRAEFERRYEAMPAVKKAELIEGKVYMPSPVRLKSHGEPHLWMVTWLGVYSAFTPGVGGGDNATTRLDEENAPQPDILLRLETSLGGQTLISADDYVEGAPELVGEVAASSAAYDLHEKLAVYARYGVQEYIVWSIYEDQVQWFRLEAGQYTPLLPDDDGITRSRVFPGLWLDVAALLRGDMATVLTVVQQGVASAEHVDFVQRLAEAAH